MKERPASRVRTMLAGQIIFNHRSATLDCIVRNLSDAGAKLEASGSVAVPDRFELVIPRKGETRKARVVWRREDEMGVAFDVPPERASASQTIAERLKAIEEENARLRQRIAELVARTSPP